MRPAATIGRRATGATPIESRIMGFQPHVRVLLMDRYPEPKRGAVSGRGHATDLDRAFHTFRICGSVLRRGVAPMAHPTSTKPNNNSEQYGRLLFNEHLRSSMVRKRFTARWSSATSRREVMKP